MSYVDFIKGKPPMPQPPGFVLAPWQKGLLEFNFLLFFFFGLMAAVVATLGIFIGMGKLFPGSVLIEIVSLVLAVVMLLSMIPVGLKAGFIGRRLTENALVKRHQKQEQSKLEERSSARDDSPNSPSGSPTSF